MEVVAPIFSSCSRVREMLRTKVGVRWGDLSYMLGGWNSWKDRGGSTLDSPRENWRPSVSTVKVVIKFAMVAKKTYTQYRK